MCQSAAISSPRTTTKCYWLTMWAKNQHLVEWCPLRFWAIRRLPLTSVMLSHQYVVSTCLLLLRLQMLPNMIKIDFVLLAVWYSLLFVPEFCFTFERLPYWSTRLTLGNWKCRPVFSDLFGAFRLVTEPQWFVLFQVDGNIIFIYLFSFFFTYLCT